MEHYVFLSYLGLELNTAKGRGNELDKTTIRRLQGNANSLNKFGINFHVVILNTFIFVFHQ